MSPVPGPAAYRRWLWVLFGPRLAVIIATLCAIVMLFLAWQSWSTLNRITGARDTLQSALTITKTLVADLLVAESGERGFLLTGDPRFLQSYRRAVTRIADADVRLDRMNVPGLGHARVTSRFRRQLQEKVAEMNAAIRLTNNERAPEAAKAIVGAAANPDRPLGVRASAKRLSGFIDQLIAHKQAQFNRMLDASGLILIASLLLAWLSFTLYARQKHRLIEFGVRRRASLERRSDRWQTVAHGRAEQLAALATYLQGVAEDERSRLARELHDELGSLMTAAKLDVARMKMHIGVGADGLASRLAHLNGLLSQSIALERRIIEDLRPSSLANLGLVAALEILAHEWHIASGIEIRTTCEAIDMAEPRELTIYRLVQESLTNIGKHANAKQVDVTLKCFPDHAEVTVADDGVGFNPDSVSMTSRGLAGMRHRLEAFGGSLGIESAKGQGTRIVGMIARG